MTETLTIPAHIENGSVLLDGPLPRDVERVEVLAYRKSTPQAGGERDLVVFLDTLPPGTKTKKELDARLDEERNAWPD